MTKRSDEAAVIALIVGLVIFVWLMFKGLFALVPAVWRYFQKERRYVEPAPTAAPRTWTAPPVPHVADERGTNTVRTPSRDLQMLVITESVFRHAETQNSEVFEEPRLLRIRQMMELDQWDAARRSLQQIAYGILGEPPEVKAEFTQVMKIFAAKDPLVSGVLQIVMPILRQSPGIRQAELYKHLPGVGVEEVRYALYFAEHLGLLQRKKSGNSYNLYEMNGVVDI